MYHSVNAIMRGSSPWGEYADHNRFKVYILNHSDKKPYSHTGTWTRANWVKASHPNQLDHMGIYYKIMKKVSPGFEPGPLDSKSKVLTRLHHETIITQGN